MAEQPGTHEFSIYHEAYLFQQGLTLAEGQRATLSMLQTGAKRGKFVVVISN